MSAPGRADGGSGISSHDPRIYVQLQKVWFCLSHFGLKCGRIFVGDIRYNIFNRDRLRIGFVSGLNLGKEFA